jgi:hypothetical protein
MKHTCTHSQASSPTTHEHPHTEREKHAQTGETALEGARRTVRVKEREKEIPVSVVTQPCGHVDYPV